MKNATITFHGGAGTVTGAHFLVDAGNVRFAVDVGMQQGCRFCDEINREPFPYDVSTVDTLIVTHGHIDHIGRIPKYVKDGFSGRIVSTPATRAIAEIMFQDSIGILEFEAEEDGVDPLYTREDVDRALALWETHEYHEAFSIGSDITVELRDAGHILGSAMAVCTREGRQLVFTGDIGNTPAPLVRETESIAGAHYLVMESVYGDREHEGVEERSERLREALRFAIDRGGVAMIPAFSLERTQALLFEINRFIENGDIPDTPVYLDSPLAIKLTHLYRRFRDELGERVEQWMKTQDAAFDFPCLTMTDSVDESKAINDAPAPKIIIAGSGMSTAGRIRHHEARYLPDENSALIIIGYQAAGSLGRELQEGAKRIKIFDDSIRVRAKVFNIEGYSAHRGRDGLVSLVSDARGTLEQVFCVMGEPRSSQFLAQRIRDFLDIKAVAPGRGDSAQIEW